MKTHLLLALAGLTISLVLPAFAQQTDTVDPQLAHQIRALIKQCEEAYNKQDAAAVAAFFSQDSEWHTPEGVFKGPQAIQQRLETFHFGRWHLKNESITVDQVNQVGFMIAATGKWSNTVQENGASAIACEGLFTTMFFLEGDALKISYSSYALTSPKGN